MYRYVSLPHILSLLNEVKVAKTQALNAETTEKVSICLKLNPEIRMVSLWIFKKNNFFIGLSR
jgi:hypothetical protein